MSDCGIRKLISKYGNEKLDDLEEVIEYLKSMALDEDTSADDFRDSITGFFEGFEVELEEVATLLDEVRSNNCNDDIIDTRCELPNDNKNSTQITETTTTSQVSGVEQVPVVEVHINTAKAVSTQAAESNEGSHQSNDPSLAAAAAATSWVCKSCTFENNLLMPLCEICGSNQPVLKMKPSKEDVEELKKDLAPINSLNSVLQSDSQRRRRRENEEESQKMLKILGDAQVSDPELCRKQLERQSVSSDKLNEYSLVEIIGFGLSAFDSELLFNHVASLNTKPQLKLHGDDDDEEGCHEDASPSEINELMFLIPDRIINRSQMEYIYHVLSRKSVEIASRYLVENFVEVGEPRLSANIRKVIVDAAKWWEESAKDTVDEEAQSIIVKDMLMKRFDERPDDSKITHRPSVSYGGESGKRGGGVIRYLEGNKVNMKNAKDKFVIEDTTVEWDGGSRGKVKTKGKRGPGFV
jgi:hypothetical protein